MVWRCEGHRNNLGDKLQQQITPCVHVAQLVVGSHCSDTSQWQIPSSVCLGNRILLPQQVPQILYDLTFCDMLLRQNSVTETKIFTIILQYTQSDLSPWCVAVTHCCNLLSSVYWPYGSCALMSKSEHYCSHTKLHHVNLNCIVLHTKWDVNY